jgi:ATP-dependent RNA helicase DDX18/HAS1
MQVVVLDEVDVLLGGGGAFQEEVTPLVERSKRLVFVTATLPEPVFLHLKTLFPGIVPAVGPNLHRIATGALRLPMRAHMHAPAGALSSTGTRHSCAARAHACSVGLRTRVTRHGGAGVTEQLVDCSGGEEITLEAGIKRKLMALAALLDAHRTQRTIIFCNKIETCRAVENALARAARATPGAPQPLPCHAAIAPATRQSNLLQFLRPPEPGEPRLALVCTDRCGPTCMRCMRARMWECARGVLCVQDVAGNRQRACGACGAL